MPRLVNYLFSNGDLDASLRNLADSSKEKVENIPKDQFLSTPIDDVIDHITSQLHVAPIELYEDAMEMVQEETKVRVNDYGRTIDVPGTSITVSLPYSGDQTLWQLQPNSWRSTFPSGKVEPPNHEGVGIVKITITQPVNEGKERIKQNLDSILEDIRFYVSSQQNQIHQHNENIRNKVKQYVDFRREHLKKQDDIADFLNIPLKRKKGVPSVKPINIKKKLVRPLPPPPSSGYKAEPGILNEEYQHILSVIRHEGRTFETTPATYSVHNEEELRDIILAHLNGHYKGGATGESFRKKGKTDIRIEDDNRAAFVAECKVWRGEKSALSAIDQLMGYLTWRDCKAALVFFNKHNSKFSEILIKLPDIIGSHQKCKKFIGTQGDGEWNYIFMSEEDEARQIELRVFLFNIYHK